MDFLKQFTKQYSLPIDKMTFWVFIHLLINNKWRNLNHEISNINEVPFISDITKAKVENGKLEFATLRNEQQQKWLGWLTLKIPPSIVSPHSPIKDTGPIQELNEIRRGSSSLIVWVRFITYFITRRIICEWNTPLFLSYPLFVCSIYRRFELEENIHYCWEIQWKLLLPLKVYIECLYWFLLLHFQSWMNPIQKRAVVIWIWFDEIE